MPRACSRTLYREGRFRSIFFARYEASNFGSPFIETTEHLLHSRPACAKAAGPDNAPLSARGAAWKIHPQTGRTKHSRCARRFKPPLTSTLSNECKRALAYAAEEAERLSHDYIGTEHLAPRPAAQVREDKSFAAKILAEYGVDLGTLRKELQDTMPQSLPKPGVFRHNGSSTTLGRFELALKVADVNVSLAFCIRKLGFHRVDGASKGQNRLPRLPCKTALAASPSIRDTSPRTC